MFEDFAASSTSSIVTFPFSSSLRPYKMLSLMLQSNRTGSCDTIPRCDLSHFKFNSRRSIPSSFYDELKRSINRKCYSVINDISLETRAGKSPYEYVRMNTRLKSHSPFFAKMKPESVQLFFDTLQTNKGPFCSRKQFKENKHVP